MGASPYTVSEVLVYSQYRADGNLNYDLACFLLSTNAPDWMGYAYQDPMYTVAGETCGYLSDREIWTTHASIVHSAVLSDVKISLWMVGLAYKQQPFAVHL